MRITGNWLRHPGTQGVFRRLLSAGHKVFAVGGCVRNDLLGRPIRDIDLATSARPDAILAACADLKTVPTGIDHGTITVIAEGLPHEVTTFRQDIETDGRHARVVFGTDVFADAKRRDFTMNALYATVEGQVFDPLNQSVADLKAHRIRFIGQAEDRITEDYLRILRFFRFTAHYGAEIDSEGYAACAALQVGLDQLSRERIGHEMRKLLQASDPAPSVAAMAQAGILRRVLPGADPAALALLVHFEAATKPDWLRRLALLGGDVSGLRLSRAEAKSLFSLSREARGDASAFALGFDLGGERGRDALLIRSALFGTPLSDAGLAEGTQATFPLKAVDLAPLQGAALGKALAAARAHWLQSGGTLDARALKAWLSQE